MNWNELNKLPTPCYVIDEAKIIANGEILKNLQAKTGAKILLAQKAFSCYDLYPTIEPFLAGTEASGLFEARLGYEYLGHKEVHVFSAAYKANDFEEILKYAGHIVFNSPRQLALYGPKAKVLGKSIGLRINPECSTQDHAIYDPCAPGSRLGTTKAQWDEHMTPELISLLDGLHFHTLCEQKFEPLARTFKVVEEKWGKYLHKLKWINMGGGHYITHKDYELKALEDFLLYVRNTYDTQVYMEPGEAFVLNAGYLLTTVLDLPVNSETKLCIVDASGACHMPDVIEMPYTPPMVGAARPHEKEFTYRIGSQTCLAGDVVGEYSFDHPLVEGERLAFADMAYYTMCKSNTFNGMPLPSIYVAHANGSLELIKSFGYEDFKYRLGK
ncbi:MAG: carboxynorspermidine decarboxylase [Phascolarctobacterium sp.]|nr:carboxynorspermidine decarboxylase [Phascolarctobacterium sp.]